MVQALLVFIAICWVAGVILLIKGHRPNKKPSDMMSDIITEMKK
jgi:hypothetical protein